MTQDKNRKVFITGGAGFIGSALAFKLLKAGRQVLIADAMTYAAAPGTIEALEHHDQCRVVKLDIREAGQLKQLLKGFEPDWVFHLAAETHVDRSIDGAEAFIQTNVLGTHNVLEACRTWQDEMSIDAAKAFRLVHISTDEVFGALGHDGVFTEDSRYQPNSPYAASKAASDHLVSSWSTTYGLNTIISNCSNNYGPRQFPEKLIPLMILRALKGENLPVYGDGQQIRDWLYVDDHADALIAMAEQGRVGETYCVGGEGEETNLTVVNTICDILDELRASSQPYSKLITHVDDRPGHDFRYAIDSSKLQTQLGWSPSHDFETGLRSTVQWYLDNEAWWAPLYERYAGQRLGTGSTSS